MTAVAAFICMASDPTRLRSGALDQSDVGIEGFGDALERASCRAGRTSFDPTDVGLVYSAAFGELNLRETVSLTELDEGQGKVVGLRKDGPHGVGLRRHGGPTGLHNFVVGLWHVHFLDQYG